jgi:deoxyribodipyrimidine photo-lyase
VTTAVVVFTRDLRTTDNPALAAAARSAGIVPLFVLDDAVLARHAGNATRLAFLLQSLRDLDGSLRAIGGRLIVRRGCWAETVAGVAAEAQACRIHLMDDVSGYAALRLRRLNSLAATARREVITHPGVMVAGPEPISPAGGDGPYQVFTPYYRRWQQAPRRCPAAAPRRLAVPAGIVSDGVPDLAGLTSARTAQAAPPGGETAARRRLSVWTDRHLGSYRRHHDDLAADATSRLSPYLHLGCLSPLAVATELGARPDGEPFVRQLAWRDFFCQLLAARPELASQDFRRPRRGWNTDPDGLAAWQAGLTGYPVVDAAMRQLSAEGFMHNRARMVVASFLTKDLGIDWRSGAAHFTALLADADVACNQLNWQWVAGTGTDAQRHRIFNPAVQGSRFDPGGEYVTRFVPELEGLPAGQIHDPPPHIRRSRGYPGPIVDHRAAAAAWRSGSPPADGWSAAARAPKLVS